ncbi:hypothetical protein [Rhizobium leguminosarum]|uniref:hypothetical protein n=1 Tax=Rhizobium leguminosarum TaxID=384 RepID=UPI001AE42A19|nr:hypothetical protein [Rhizobium leguminosarum]MBP2449524.1 hypothetical protein [Rhizobium leguminosarum]
MTTTRKSAVLGALLLATLGGFGAIAYAEDGTTANTPSAAVSGQSQASVSVEDGTQLATDAQAANQKCGSPGKDGKDGGDGASGESGKGGKSGKGGAAGICTN